MNIVFASGVLVPQQIAGIDYFRLARQTFPDALFTDVSGLGTGAQRAEQLARQIAARFPQGNVHIIAHSMAGLDSRFALSHDLHGLAGLVESLSTITTPHAGSPVADLLVGPKPSSRDPRRLVYSLITQTVALLRFPAGAITDLTTGAAAAFEKQCPDVAGVGYFHYAASGLESILLAATRKYISKFEGPNDGLVSVRSALRGRPAAEPVWDTDHIGVTGHDLDNLPSLAAKFDHLAAYRRILDRAANKLQQATTP